MLKILSFSILHSQIQFLASKMATSINSNPTSPSLVSTFLSSPVDPPIYSMLIKNSLANKHSENSSTSKNFDYSPSSTHSSLHTSRTSGFYSTGSNSSEESKFVKIDRPQMPPPEKPIKQQLPVNLADSKPRIFVTPRTAALVKNSQKSSKILARKTKTSSLDLSTSERLSSTMPYHKTTSSFEAPENVYAGFFMPKSATFERLATTREESDSDDESEDENAGTSDRKSCTSVPTTSAGVKRISSGTSAGKIFRENHGPVAIFRNFFGLKR